MAPPTRDQKNLHALVGSAAAAGVRAFAAERPDLSPREVFGGMFQALLDVTVPEQAAPKPQEPKARPPTPRPAPRGPHVCITCGRRPRLGERSCGPCARKQRSRAQAAPNDEMARFRKRRSHARRARPAKPFAKEPRERRPTRTSFVGGKAAFFKAMDHANDGMVSKYLDALDDGSPHLRDYAAAIGRGRGSRCPVHTWREAVDSLTPGRACYWKDVNLDRLKRLSEAMAGAFEAGGGGVTNGSRAGFSFLGLRAPLETEQLLELENEEARCRAEEEWFTNRQAAVGG